MPSKIVLAFIGMFLPLGTTGCGEKARGFERYVPPPGQARAAVAASLECWRNGNPTDALAGGKPSVHVVDKQRKPQERLTGYEILGEIPAENARCYAARLTFDDPGGPRVVRYLVVGTDPIWVFRQEDYEMISHWSHPMKEPDDRATGPDETRTHDDD